MVLLWIAFVLSLLYLVLAGLYMLALMAKRKPKRGFHGKLGEYDYAHRGLYNPETGVPETSLTAFRLAAQKGYGAELDVHLSRDGRLVVMHDTALKRTAGANANIPAVTAQVLGQLTLEGTKEKIPYLEQVVPLFENAGPLLIEIKTDNGNHAELTRKVCGLMRQYPDVTFCIESFDPRVLLWLKKHRPDVIRGQLSCNFIKERNGLSFATAFLLKNLLMNFLTRPDFIAYRYEDRSCLAPALSRKLWKPQEFSWTVQDPETAERLKKDGALIIFEGFEAK